MFKIILLVLVLAVLVLESDRVFAQQSPCEQVRDSLSQNAAQLATMNLTAQQEVGKLKQRIEELEKKYESKKESKDDSKTNK